MGIGEDVVRAIYASWGAGDLDGMLSWFDDEVYFAVHMPAEAASFIGRGRGRELFAGRLKRFLAEYEVRQFKPRWIKVDGEGVDAQVAYRYWSEDAGMGIDGTQRHIWQVVGDKAVHFEVIHDARRMGAFFELVAQVRANA